MNLKVSKTALKQILIVSLLLSLACVAALGVALSRGARSKSWLAVPAVIAERSFGLNSRAGRMRVRWRTVKVDYTFDGRAFQRKVALFASSEEIEEGTNLTVYVNPKHPVELASEKGFLACDYAIPMACAIASLAFLIVLVCIVYSPTDDYDSELNEGLM